MVSEYRVARHLIQKNTLEIKSKKGVTISRYVYMKGLPADNIRLGGGMCVIVRTPLPQRLMPK